LAESIPQQSSASCCSIPCLLFPFSCSTCSTTLKTVLEKRSPLLLCTTVVQIIGTTELPTYQRDLFQFRYLLLAARRPTVNLFLYSSVLSTRSFFSPSVPTEFSHLTSQIWKTVVDEKNDRTNGNDRVSTVY
jgi:hypothetical protein